MRSSSTLKIEVVLNVSSSWVTIRLHPKASFLGCWNWQKVIKLRCGGFLTNNKTTQTKVVLSCLKLLVGLFTILRNLNVQSCTSTFYIRHLRYRRIIRFSSSNITWCWAELLRNNYFHLYTNHVPGNANHCMRPVRDNHCQPLHQDVQVSKPWHCLF